MPSTPGTLVEYDMILALTQATINSQFNILYNTTDPNNTSEKLIQHTLKIGYIKYDAKTKTMKATEQGITAQIESPTVDLNDVGLTATLYRSVRIVIKMTTGTLTYWDDGVKETKDLSGYSFSWVSEIGRRDIEKVEEEVMMHPNAKTALNQVSQDDYLISSLFCLFDSTRVANTFKLMDADGKLEEDDTQVAAAMNSLIVTYTHLDPVKYPYVLGYGVSQKVPASTTGTPAFCPAKFYFSTTPNDTADLASVNFCMINGDTHDNTLVDPTKNPSAGVLSSPLPTVTRSENSPSDGIFAASTNMFYNYWLKPTILDTFAFSTSLFDGVTMSSLSISNTRTPDGALQESSWSSDCIDTGGLWTGEDTRRYSGNSSVTVTFSSILQSQPSGTIAANATRSIALKVVDYVYNKLEFRMDALGEQLDEGYLDATTNWDFELSITADSNGKWTVTKVDWNVPGETVQGEHLDALAYLDAVINLFAGNVEKLVTFFTGLGDIDDSAFDGISDALASISTNFVMPGGDVYTFAGLDCDGDGNLYSHIKYKAAS